MNYDVEHLLRKMAADLKTRLNARQVTNPLMIGIHTGGVWVAESLHALLHLEDPLGKLDISFYRDDFTRIGLNPAVLPSELPFTVDGRHIILVDDVQKDNQYHQTGQKTADRSPKNTLEAHIAFSHMRSFQSALPNLRKSLRPFRWNRSFQHCCKHVHAPCPFCNFTF